jgi:hypothetical protein
MAANVSLVLARLSGRVESPKLQRSIENVLEYLNAQVDRVLEALPPNRAISFLETALFCTLVHFRFRQVTGVSIEPYERLKEFCIGFGSRESAQKTEYRFDSA